MKTNRKAFGADDAAFLLELLKIDSITPMESQRKSDLRHAQARYLDEAKKLGFEAVHFEPPAGEALEGADVPLTVRERAREMKGDFLSDQPNLVLRLGGEQPRERTLLFNFHMDTVSGDVKVREQAGRIFGRGAVDCKGPAVAVLAAVRDALIRRPALAEQIAIVIQSVAGEEGGAMGVYGTRYLARGGSLGALNIVCEPTNFKYFDHTTSSMTLRIDVQGQGATDDAPKSGDNATIILSAIAVHLVKHLSDKVSTLGAKMCVAGLHTGNLHNRVYGTGQLHLNFAYKSMATARAIEALVEIAFADAIHAIEKEFAVFEIAQKTAGSAAAICTKTWVKREIPVLSNRNEWMEAFLAKAGLERHDDESAHEPFTCDAMWLQDEATHTVVFGPGDLGVNHAHAEDEYVDVSDLELYTGQLSALITSFVDETMPPAAHRVFEGESLHAFYRTLFETLGLSREDAVTAADGLYYSDLRGLDTHGAVNLAGIYLPMIEEGQIKLQSEPAVISAHGPCLVLDGQGALGYVVGRHAMKEAIALAKVFGIGCVAVRNSTHAGSFGFYTDEAVKEKMIGIALTNLGSQGLLIPPGGTKPLVGTNVIAAAAPGLRLEPFSLDMSTAVVSSGRIKQYARMGKSVPAGWIVNGEGRSVTDPAQFVDGKATLSFLGGETAGYKGFGLGILVDILSGVLSGASVGTENDSTKMRKDHNVGHFFLAIDPEKFIGRQAFCERMDGMLSTLGAGSAYPGSPEHLAARERSEAGIPIESPIAARLLAAAEKYSIKGPKEITKQSEAKASRRNHG